MLAPLSNYWGGLAPPGPPSSYAYGFANHDTCTSSKAKGTKSTLLLTYVVVVVVLLFYVHGKHLRSCRECQLT